MFVYVYCYEKFDSSYWVEGFYILNIRWVFCFSELFFEMKVMDKIMFCFIILKFFEIIFVVFIMLKNECCYKGNWNYNDGIFIFNDIFLDMIDECW